MIAAPEAAMTKEHTPPVRTIGQIPVALKDDDPRRRAVNPKAAAAAAAAIKQHVGDRPVPHRMQLGAGYAMLKRIVGLELLKAGEVPAGRFRLTIDLTLLDADRDDEAPCWDHEVHGPEEQLEALAGGLKLLLARRLGEGEDFVVLSKEEQRTLNRA